MKRVSFWKWKAYHSISKLFRILADKFPFQSNIINFIHSCLSTIDVVVDGNMA